MRKKEKEDVIGPKPLDANLFFVLFISIMMIFASGVSPIGNRDNSTLSESPCYKINGEVVWKEIEGERHYLYVELYIDDAGVEGYQVRVSEVTYDSYEVGDTYERITCDTGWFNMFKDTIQNLLEAGVLEQF